MQYLVPDQSEEKIVPARKSFNDADSAVAKSHGSAPSSWRDTNSLAAWVGQFPPFSAVCWAAANFVFLVAILAYLLMRVKSIRKPKEPICDSRASLIPVRFTYGDSEAEEETYEKPIEDCPTVDDCFVLQAQRDIKVSLYKPFWVSKVLGLNLITLILPIYKKFV